MIESTILKLVAVAASRLGLVTFRNNVAKAWVGSGAVRCVGRAYTVLLQPGDVVIRKARVLDAGLCKGSSDRIGWKPHTIRPEDVGRTIAVFVAIETKSAKGRLSKEQQNFSDQVGAAGGISIVARSPEDVSTGVGAWERKNT